MDFSFKKLVPFLVGFSLLFAVSLFWKQSLEENSPFHTKISFETVNIVAEVADTKISRAKGLSGRTTLLENEGLLFVFDTPGLYPFWMKDMLFPIDILWISPGLRIIHIEKDVSPDTFPHLFVSEESALYVLEVISGFTEKYKIKIGDTLHFKN